MRELALAIAIGVAGGVAQAEPKAAKAEADEADGARIRAAVAADLDARGQVLDRTDRILADKRAIRAAELATRARAAYKLLRAGTAPLWVDGDAGVRLIRRRVAARRILTRDVTELGLLDGEQAAAAAARDRLAASRARLDQLAIPPPGSLRMPVIYGQVAEPFGVYRHAASGASLSRRGVELTCYPGRNVRAVADGRVRYAGPVRGLGAAVIVDHGDYLSVLGRLSELAVTAGERVTRGDKLAESKGDRVYIEIRLDIGAGGQPIDPAPLLGAAR